MSSGRLAGQVAVITGAGSGLGAATARRFVAEGANVIVAEVQEQRGKALVEELGASSRFVATDVTDEAAVAAAVDLAVATFGRLDVMFNNAGIIGAVGPIAALDLDEFDFTVGVNLRGVAAGIKHAARVMEPQGTGVILSTTSPAATAGGLGPHVYSATKAGVIALTMSVAAELRPKGIRVNAIMPGAMVTEMTADLTAGDPDALEQARADVPRRARCIVPVSPTTSLPPPSTWRATTPPTSRRSSSPSMAVSRARRARRRSPSPSTSDRRSYAKVADAAPTDERGPTMIKQMSFVRRAAGIASDEFGQLWCQEALATVKAMPADARPRRLANCLVRHGHRPTEFDGVAIEWHVDGSPAGHERWVTEQAPSATVDVAAATVVRVEERTVFGDAWLDERWRQHRGRPALLLIGLIAASTA